MASKTEDVDRPSQKGKEHVKQPLSVTIKGIVRNVARLLRISWEMDPFTTCAFFFVAFLGSLVPVVTASLFTYAIDHIQAAQDAKATIVPVIVVVVLATRSVIYALQDVIYNNYARMYLDHIFRYKLQNKISYDFYKKVVKFDIAHFEDPETQNHIAKVKDMMLWRVPDYVRTFSYFFANAITYSAAFVVSVQFGWWVPILVTIVTLPRLYIQTQYGNVQWSVWDGSAAESRKLWYLSWILQDKVAVREMRIAQTDNIILSKFKVIQEELYRRNKEPLNQYMKVLIAPPIAEALVVLLIAVLFLPDTVSQAVSLGSFALLINMLGQLNAETAHMAIT